MKVAVIGAGVSGLVCASILREHADVTVFEAEARVGGHSHTLRVEHEGREIWVDTGFIVFNDRNYPHFSALLERLGAPWRPAGMSFSVRCERTGLEWGGGSLGAVFAQRRNLARPAFWRMLRDLRRFCREAPADAGRAPPDALLGDYLREGGYGREFREWYLLPMGSAIWSAPLGSMESFPLRMFVEFFENHGMLELSRARRPEWRTVVGGSRVYVERLAEPLRGRIRAGCTVARVARAEDHVEVKVAGMQAERFDRVALATHSDQALAALADASPAERDVLGAMPYSPSEVVLHADASLLPRRRRAWSCWNYRLPAAPAALPTVTYNLSMLQGLPTRVPLCVTLNETAAVDPAKVFARLSYSHPQYTAAGVAARRRRAEISGERRTHFCGAYWGNGFHEDGVRSGMDAAAEILAALRGDRSRPAPLAAVAGAGA